jgi:hypothetical protein
MRPPDASRPQRLGDRNNLQDRNYANDAPNDWKRGFGKNGIESAEGQANFDPGYKGKR